MAENGSANAGKMENGGDDDDKDDPLSDELYGYPKAEIDRWVSWIRELDPRSATTTCLRELQENEAAFSVCTVNFHDKEHGTLLAFRTAKGLLFWPKRSLTSGCIHIYKFVDDGKSPELLHKTQVGRVPLALCQFQGRLLAGIESVLRLYDLGEKRLYIFADDSVPRWITTSYHVDSDTMAGAHKFGDVNFARLPQDLSDEIQVAEIKWEQGKLDGAPNKVEEIVHIHIDDVVNCLQKSSLIPSDGECIIYGTVIHHAPVNAPSLIASIHLSR